MNISQLYVEGSEGCCRTFFTVTLRLDFLDVKPCSSCNFDKRGGGYHCVCFSDFREEGEDLGLFTATCASIFLAV